MDGGLLKMGDSGRPVHPAEVHSFFIGFLEFVVAFLDGRLEELDHRPKRLGPI